MQLPENLFLPQVAEKKLFLFATEELSEHFFLCVATDDPDIFFVCCTSQFEKRKRYFELTGLPSECLVRVKPSPQNTLSKDSYIDCNKYFVFTRSELYKKYTTEKLKFTGEISDVEIEQILLGLDASPLIEEDVKEIFRRALKKILP